MLSNGSQPIMTTIIHTEKLNEAQCVNSTKLCLDLDDEDFDDPDQYDDMDDTVVNFGSVIIHEAFQGQYRMRPSLH